jgi:hypothetical protein
MTNGLDHPPTNMALTNHSLLMATHYTWPWEARPDRPEIPEPRPARPCLRVGPGSDFLARWLGWDGLRP